MDSHRAVGVDFFQEFAVLEARSVLLAFAMRRRLSYINKCDAEWDIFPALLLQLVYDMGVVCR